MPRGRPSVFISPFSPFDMQRRPFLLSLGSLLLGIAPATYAQKNAITFEEMYAGTSVLGLKFSEKLLQLSGKSVSILGFMAPPLKANAGFLVLTKEPVSLCPFCNSDQDWPDNIILVRLEAKKDFVQSNRLIEVTGRLEIGSETDEETGFVSLVRLVDADYRIV